MRFCRECKLDKPSDAFAKNQSKCRACKKAYKLRNSEEIRIKNQLYRELNRESRQQYNAEYRSNNKAKIKESSRIYRQQARGQRREYNRSYVARTREVYNLRKSRYKRTRKSVDPLYRLIEVTRSRISRAFHSAGYTKKSSTYKMLGIDFASFQEYLVGTAIKNYGKYFPKRRYHLDHIIPCASAKTEEELIKLQHYTNFQLLYPKDNWAKGAKLPQHVEVK